MTILRTAVVLSAILGSGCAIIQADEVGVKTRLGQLTPGIYEPGPVPFNPFVARVHTLPTRTVNLEVALDLPSKEGLNVRSVISILYSLDAQRAPEIFQSIGPNYEESVILAVFRSAAADVTARFLAKDMHTAQRATIEREIAEAMGALIGDRGFKIEAVLMKSIQLPAGLYRAIEEKLEAEQAAQRMEFVLQREEQEAERRRIEAKGIRDAQQIIADGLTEDVLTWQSISAFRELSTSPNTKVIVTSGKGQMIIDGD